MSKKMYQMPHERLHSSKRPQRLLPTSRTYLRQPRDCFPIENEYMIKNIFVSPQLKLKREVEDLRKIINSQHSRLRTLEKSIEESQPKIIVLEEISKADGKRRVEDYFKEHGSADIEELMVNLRISVHAIIDILDELHKEGKLVPKGE